MTVMVADEIPSHLWGKAGDGALHHPLLFHMLDVGNVAGEIYSGLLSARARSVLSAAPTMTAAHIAFVVSLHDLGKASPAFQLKRPDLLRDWGAAYPWPRSTQEAASDSSVNHGTVGAAVLPGVLEDLLGMDRQAALNVASAIAGHHGRFATFNETDGVSAGARKVRSGVGRQEWDQLRRRVAEQLREVFAVGALPDWTPDGAAAFVLAGLTSVADWIGSNERWFPYRPDLSLDQYGAVSMANARTALTELGLSPWVPRSQTFSERFGFAPRPAQEAADLVARDLDEPAIVVIEAEMGSGKTETAFNLVAEWALDGQASGTYVALPTRATSNQMFTRAVSFIERSTGTASAQVQLIHGLARLTADFEHLLDVPPPEPVNLTAVYDDARTEVRADEWFTARKRSLLSPWGVGTVDALLTAALRVRHGSVRMFGLLDKAVIVDEVHAYDVYMSTLLDRLLQWLGYLKVPVVLLSATLPAERRSELLSSWADRPVSVSPGYPGISWATPTQEGAVTVPSASPRTVKLDHRAGVQEPSDIAHIPVGAVADGGCVLVVCNTVRRAQDTFAAVKHQLEGVRWGDQTDVHLLHARLLFADRDDRERHVLDSFGPRGNRPDRAIVVATQVVEQSLDLDFDLIVSDLAPVDLLLQRMGRLHRHARPRPPHLSEPELVVVGFSRGSDGSAVFPAGSVTVYGQHLLVRTIAWTADRHSVQIPHDLPVLVDGVYGDQPVPDPLLLAQAVAAESEFSEQIAHDSNEAKLRYLASPDDLAVLATATAEAGADDNPELHQRLQALTRLAGPSVEIIALSASGEQLTCGPDGPPVDTAQRPDRHTTRALLGRSVSITQLGLVQALTASPVPTGWQESPWLRHHRPVVFDADASAIVGRWELRLDPDLGLVISRINATGAAA